MKKMRLAIIIFFCAITLPILFYKLLSFQASLRFKESTPPDNTAESLKSLVVSMLQEKESFAGNIKVEYIDPNHNGLWNRAQITVLNTSILDDSIGAVEYIAIAERKNDVWRLTSYKSHWKCARHIIPQFWQTSACI
ncbi:hypothetical protein KKF69_06835 [Patescibacteria group bacterium]|nr:hypothetical protein [Patescibacteria group bacterium]MBU4017157.1 hypothetical protein [Patescibacteria group bacterium]